MLPVLLDLKFLKIYTFGVFLLLAFFWGSFLLWKNFLLTSQKEEEIFDGLFISLAGGLFVSRLVHVALNFSSFGFDILKFILINGYPGLSLYGFIVGTMLSLYGYCALKKIKFSEVADYFVPSIFLALGFGKLGSFFSGAEIGEKTTFPISLRYPGISGSHHLTALYEGILFFFGAFLAYQFLFAIRRNKYQKMGNFLFFCWYFSFVYFIFDFLKVRNTLMYGLSFNSLISLFLLLTFSFYFLYYFKNSLSGMMKGISYFFQNKYGKGTNKNIHKKSKT